jgi:hypothetical protein
LVELRAPLISHLVNRGSQHAVKHFSVVFFKRDHSDADPGRSGLGSVLLQLDGDKLSGYIVILQKDEMLEADFSESLKAVKSGTPLVCDIAIKHRDGETVSLLAIPEKLAAGQNGGFEPVDLGMEQAV